MNTEIRILTLTFSNLNELLEFYNTNPLHKSIQRATGILVSMASKGQMIVNDNGTIALTWYFRNEIKYSKFLDAYTMFKFKPKPQIIQKRKTYVEILNQE